MRIFRRAPVLLVLQALLLLPLLASAQSKAGQKEDPFFSGPPFSLNDILQRVNIIPDRRLITAIDRRGLNFSPTQADYQKLKTAGASAQLIQVVTDKTPPPPKPAPPTPPPAPALSGPITLQCGPGECEILVNGKAHGLTSKGLLQLHGLPVGEIVVDFRKDGFEGQQVSLMLHADRPASKAVTLKPTAATQAAAGKQLLNKMIEKMGGVPALEGEAMLSASGNASLWPAGGQRTEWRVACRLKLPSQSLIEINGAGLHWWTSLSASESKADGTHKMKGGPVALEMEKLVRFYRDYQPLLLFARLQKMNLSATDLVPDANGQWHLHAIESDGSYNVAAATDFTPVRVVHESASGLGSGLEIIYADYATIGKSYYPKTMAIKFSDQSQHGLELHFDHVEFVSKLTDKDFHR
jgi:hypothetical protein